MNRIVWLVILLVIGFQTASFGQTKHCLFIGDSYFSHNDLDKEFLAVWSEEVSDTLLITTHNRNGATIDRQWRHNSDELLRLFGSERWDYVIIELPRLAAPQDSNLVQILHAVDSSVRNCSIICIAMDFCNSFPEMACAKDLIEVMKCNEFSNCSEKLMYVKKIADNLESRKFANSIRILPFPHYKYYLQEQYSIELGSDDEYGHPNPFSQACLARFILFDLLKSTHDKINILPIDSVNSKSIYLSSFYNTFYND